MTSINLSSSTVSFQSDVRDTILDDYCTLCFRKTTGHFGIAEHLEGCSASSPLFTLVLKKDLSRSDLFGTLIVSICFFSSFISPFFSGGFLTYSRSPAISDHYFEEVALLPLASIHPNPDPGKTGFLPRQCISLEMANRSPLYQKYSEQSQQRSKEDKSITVQLCREEFVVLTLSPLYLHELLVLFSFPLHETPFIETNNGSCRLLQRDCHCFPPEILSRLVKSTFSRTRPPVASCTTSCPCTDVALFR